MEAVWCHWCHVMDETTYKDPAVVKLINQHFIAVKVDQDGNPALSQRYEDWGWPATVMFDGKGRELNKERGYVEPAAMAQVLQALVDKPEPMPEAPVSKPAALALLSAQQKQVLTQRLEAAYDAEHGAWGNRHKFLQVDALDYLLLNASAGDQTARERVRQTLLNARAIIDPVWGGIFQYSDDGTWNSPHYEKIMGCRPTPCGSTPPPIRPSAIRNSVRRPSWSPAICWRISRRRKAASIPARTPTCPPR